VSFSGFSVSVTTPEADGIYVTNGATAAIYSNTIRAAGPGDNAIEVGYYTLGPATATITGNQIITTKSSGDGDNGIVVNGLFSANPSATIAYNSIMGPGFTGIFVGYGGTAAISNNLIGGFACANQATDTPCGPDWLNDYQGGGIVDYFDPGLGTTITNNLVYASDEGVEFWAGCPGCVVTGNIVMNSFNYGLAGFDGTYVFGPNTVIGGAYGVAAASTFADTTVTLSHVLIVDPSAAPLYTEPDLGPGTATIGGTWTVVG